MREHFTKAERDFIEANEKTESILRSIDRMTEELKELRKIAQFIPKVVLISHSCEHAKETAQ